MVDGGWMVDGRLNGGLLVVECLMYNNNKSWKN